MSIDSALPVIAVFGSNKPKDGEVPSARLLAEAVQGSGSVLLTGGDLVKAETVKDAAIRAANEAGTPDAPASWIGVANEDAALPAQPRGPRSVVVTPGWGHRRNFVEACLCDAAIAVGAGSPGTCSEALFCLYLGRPVVFVGNMTAAEVTPRKLRERALTRKGLGWPRQPTLAVEVGIAGAYEWADDPDNSGDIRPLPLDHRSAATLVGDLLRRLGPDFDALVDNTSWDLFVRTALGPVARSGVSWPG